MADIRDPIYTTFGVDINITINKLYLKVSISIPDPGTQPKFNKSIKSSFTPTFDSWTNDKRMVGTGQEYQLDVAWYSDNNLLNILVAAHQTAAKSVRANKAKNIAIFEHLNVRRYFVKIDGRNYPIDPSDLDYAKIIFWSIYRS